ncbi:MAG: AzlC family ABC transporter permease, partial [Pseudomonadota bacterium]
HAPGRLHRIRWHAFRSGFSVCGTTPGFVLLATSSGFGALAVDAGVTLELSLLMSVIFFALPAQVGLIDELARGASVLVVALAVSVTAIRLLPMAVSLTPYLSPRREPLALKLFAIHQLAITPWLEAQRRLPGAATHVRLPLYAGIGTGITVVSAVGTVIGYMMADMLPLVVTSALLFLTPIYFLLSLMGSATSPAHWLAIIIGAALGPALFTALPGTGVDLLLTGLIGGTVAWLLARMRRDAAA